MSRRSKAQRLSHVVGLRLHDTDEGSLKAAREACDELSYEIAKLEVLERPVVLAELDLAALDGAEG